MEKRPMQYHGLYCLIILLVFLCGCGKSDSAVSGSNLGVPIEEDETAYVAQPFFFPKYASLDAACSNGEEIYYVATELGLKASGCYLLASGTEEPERLYDLALTEGQKIFSMTRDATGNIYYFVYEANPEGGRDVVPNVYNVWQIDQQGKQLFALNLAEYIKDPAVDVPVGLALDDENHIMVAMTRNIIVFDQRGQLLFEINTINQICGIVNQNGEVLVEYIKGNQVGFRKVDFYGKKLADVVGYEAPGGPFRLATTGNENLLMGSASSVYQYEPGLGKLIKKFDWLTYDHTGLTAGDLMLPYGEKGVLLINRDIYSSPMKIDATIFREATEGEEVSLPKEKKIITVGYPNRTDSFYLAEMIIDFNKANPEYEIEVKTYEDDYDRFYADILSGSCPDILVAQPDELELLAERGVLEDLYAYIDRDDTLDRSDFYENILHAYETQGFLYAMPSRFWMKTIVAKTSVVGDRAGWNIDEFMVFANSFPDGRGVFDAEAKSTVLKLIKMAYDGELVRRDADNPLNRELLEKMLTFANQYENDNEYWYQGDPLKKIEEDQMKLVNLNFYEGASYFGLSKIFGEPITFIGYPAEQGNGNLIYTKDSFAISSGSKYKEAAWQFLSRIFSKEGLTKIHNRQLHEGFYIRRDMLAYHYDWLRERFGSFETITYLFKTENQPLLASQMQYWPFEENRLELEETFEQIEQLIDSVDTAYRPIAALDAIIEEEALFYFNGVKPLEEVADVIENRVRTYVNEMK